MTEAAAIALRSVCDEIVHEYEAGAHEVSVIRFLDGFMVRSDAHEEPTCVLVDVLDEESSR